MMNETNTRRRDEQQLCVIYNGTKCVLIKTNHHKNGEDVNTRDESETEKESYTKCQCPSNKYYVMCDEIEKERYTGRNPCVKNDANGKLLESATANNSNRNKTHFGCEEIVLRDF